MAFSFVLYTRNRYSDSLDVVVQRCPGYHPPSLEERKGSVLCRVFVVH